MNEILSYKDWLNSESGNRTLLNPYNSYLDYIDSWYETSFRGETTDELTADAYRNFLLTLNNISDDPEILAYIENLDYENINEVTTAIPYFAKNLRIIASKIIKNRIDAKYTIQTESFINSNKGIELEIYKKLLNFYVTTNDLSDTDFLDNVKNVSLRIEELYDDNEYLDKQPDLDADDYFITSGTSSFFEYTDDYTKWVVKSGFNDLYSNNSLFNPETSAILPLSGYIDYELSGTSVDFYKGNLSDMLMGEPHYYLSGDGINRSAIEYSSASKPWNNLSNRYFPTIATFSLIDSLYDKKEIGGFFIPSKLGMPVALGKNKFFNLDNISLSGNKLEHFPNGSIYSNGFSFTKTYQDSYRPYNSYLNWIPIKQIRGLGRGILASDGIYQEMIPYQTLYESTKTSYLGINRITDKIDPWYLSGDKTWENDTDFPSDFRNIYNVAEWYESVSREISGKEDQWAIDIYGNNYALYKDISGNNFYDRRENTTGKLYIRSVDNKLQKYFDYFSESISIFTSGFEYDSLKYFNVYDDIIIMEDINNEITIQKVELTDNEYVINSVSIFSTLNFDPSGYATLGHYYDDRTQTLYFGRYNSEISGSIEFTLYKYDDGNIISMYDFANDESIENLLLKSNYSFSDISPFPSILISPIHNKIFITYIAYSDSNARYIVIIPIIMQGNFSIDEITVVEPSTSSSLSATETIESIRLLNTMISEDNLILMLEGEITNNKYLQVVQL